MIVRAPIILQRCVTHAVDRRLLSRRDGRHTWREDVATADQDVLRRHMNLGDGGGDRRYDINIRPKEVPKAVTDVGR